MHEVVVALGMVLLQAHVFVEIERGDLREVEPLVLVHSCQLLVEPQGRAPGWQSEHGVGFGIERLGDSRGGSRTQFLVGVADDDFH